MSQIILILMIFALVLAVALLHHRTTVLIDQVEKLGQRVEYLEHNDLQTRMTIASNIRYGNATNIEDMYNSLKCQKPITQDELEELLQPKIQLL